jgi:uncharacterized protein YrrD
MRKANELIGKTIVQQGNGERIATVYDVVVDDEVRRVVALLIQTGGWLRDARVVPWSRIASIGDVILVRGDAPVIVKASDTEIADQVKQNVRISGTAIVTDNGERIGTVGDLFIDDDGRVLGYEVKQGFLSLAGHKFLPVSDVQAIGQDAVIASTDRLPSVKEAQQEAADQAKGAE